MPQSFASLAPREFKKKHGLLRFLAQSSDLALLQFPNKKQSKLKKILRRATDLMMMLLIITKLGLLFAVRYLVLNFNL